MLHLYGMFEYLKMKHSKLKNGTEFEKKWKCFENEFFQQSMELSTDLLTIGIPILPLELHGKVQEVPTAPLAE